MQTWSLSWGNVAATIEQGPEHPWTYTREEEGKKLSYVSMCSHICLIQMTVLAKLPNTVQQAAAMDTLPEAGGYI